MFQAHITHAKHTCYPCGRDIWKHTVGVCVYAPTRARTYTHTYIYNCVCFFFVFCCVCFFFVFFCFLFSFFFLFLLTPTLSPAPGLPEITQHTCAIFKTSSKGYSVFFSFILTWHIFLHTYILYIHIPVYIHILCWYHALQTTLFVSTGTHTEQIRNIQHLFPRKSPTTSKKKIEYIYTYLIYIYIYFVEITPIYMHIYSVSYHTWISIHRFMRKYTSTHTLHNTHTHTHTYIYIWLHPGSGVGGGACQV